MAIVPVGSMAVPLERLRETIAASATFQTRTGSADATEAIEHVYRESVANGGGLSELRPYVVVRLGQQGANEIAEGVQIELVVSGGLLVFLEANADETIEDEGENYIDFLNFAGLLFDELTQLSGVDDYFPSRRIELVYAPTRTLRAARNAELGNDVWQVCWLFNYGIGG